MPPRERERIQIVHVKGGGVVFYILNVQDNILNDKNTSVS